MTAAVRAAGRQPTPRGRLRGVAGGTAGGGSVDGSGAAAIVVGAALLDGGRLLAAHRAGGSCGWEFPGGKVEPGESEPVALARECREELGVHIEVGERVGPQVPVAGGRLLLRVWTARVVRGEPAARDGEHTELRWLRPDQLGEVDWLPADRPILPAVRALLGCPDLR